MDQLRLYMVLCFLDISLGLPKHQNKNASLRTNNWLEVEGKEKATTGSGRRKKMDLQLGISERQKSTGNICLVLYFFPNETFVVFLAIEVRTDR